MGQINCGFDGVDALFTFIYLLWCGEFNSLKMNLHTTRMLRGSTLHRHRGGYELLSTHQNSTCLVMRIRFIAQSSIKSKSKVAGALKIELDVSVFRTILLSACSWSRVATVGIFICTRTSSHNNYYLVDSPGRATCHGNPRNDDRRRRADDDDFSRYNSLARSAISSIELD